MKTPTPKAVKKPMPKPKGKSKTCDSPPQNSTIPAPNLSKSASNLSEPIPKPPLTGKQQLFVEEYLVDLNATQAAVRAGYSVRTARQVGCRLLTYVDIKAAIEAAIEERKKRITVTGDMVIAELALIAFAGMKDFVEIDEGGAIRAFPLDTLAEGKDRIIRKVREKRTIKSTADGDQVLDSIYEFELVDKIKSLELLARHMGLLHDKTEIDVRQPVIIEIVKFAK
jgi:phage terminase small subunit